MFGVPAPPLVQKPLQFRFRKMRTQSSHRLLVPETFGEFEVAGAMAAALLRCAYKATGKFVFPRSDATHPRCCSAHAMCRMLFARYVNNRERRQKSAASVNLPNATAYAAALDSTIASVSCCDSACSSDIWMHCCAYCSALSGSPHSNALSARFNRQLRTPYRFSIDRNAPSDSSKYARFVSNGASVTRIFSKSASPSVRGWPRRRAMSSASSASGCASAESCAWLGFYVPGVPRI